MRRGSASRAAALLACALSAASTACATSPEHQQGLRDELDRKVAFYYTTHKQPGTRGVWQCYVQSDGEDCEEWWGLADYLGGAVREAPRDPYVVGQAVYSLVRGGSYEEALALVEGCASEGWWCAMLRGHALAEAGRTLAAEVAFDEALGLMPEVELCEWTDVAILTTVAGWSRYRGESCRDRLWRLEELWWLSDPSYLMPGSDRKVEHYNRMAWATLHDDRLENDAERMGRCSVSMTVDNGCGHSRRHHRDVVLRGMEYLREDGRWNTVEGVYYRVIPDDDALLAPFEASTDDWNLTPYERVLGLIPQVWENEPADRTTFRPRWGRLEQVDAQVAFFERGDSIHAAAAIDLPDTSLAFRRGSSGGAALMLHASAWDPPVMVSSRAPHRRYVFRTAALRRRYLVAVEALGEGAVARTRFGHGLPHDPSAPLRLSDLLLYSHEGGEPPDSLEDALPRMRGGSRWTRGETMGVFLEVYAPRETVTYSVAVELAPSGGGLGRLARAVGLGERPVQVRWTEQGAGGDFSLAFTLDLAEVPEGDYDVRVSVGWPGLTDAVVEKAIRVVAPAGTSPP